MTIAKREQSESGRDFSLHSNKKSSSIKDQQEYLVSALPNIGPSAAKALLEHFGSVSKIFSAIPPLLYHGGMSKVYCSMVFLSWWWLLYVRQFLCR